MLDYGSGRQYTGFSGRVGLAPPSVGGGLKPYVVVLKKEGNYVQFKQYSRPVAAL
jgi:hypothetical protein